MKTSVDNGKTYADKLKDPRWQKKRLEVLSRDQFKCVCCGEESKSLHVHHRVYERNREPWEIETWKLSTLCCDCHESQHETWPNAGAELIRSLKLIGFDPLCVADLAVHINGLAQATNPHRIESREADGIYHGVFDAISILLLDPDLAKERSK